MQTWLPERISAVEVLPRLWSKDGTDIITFEKAEWYMGKLMELNQEASDDET